MRLNKSSLALIAGAAFVLLNSGCMSFPRESGLKSIPRGAIPYKTEYKINGKTVNTRYSWRLYEQNPLLRQLKMRIIESREAEDYFWYLDDGPRLKARQAEILLNNQGDGQA